MTKSISIAVVVTLAACATHPNRAPFEVAHPKDPKEVLEELSAEVDSGGWETRHSLPELKYAKEHYIVPGKTIDTADLLSADGRRFTVLIINCPSSSFPGSDFMLAYLRDPAGVIVDWKSQWLYNRDGRLKTKVLDVDHDGAPDFCFVCERHRRPELLLSAFCVRNGKFDPVIAESTTYFDVVFEDNVLEGGLVVQPQLKGRYIWQTDKLYEIPIKVLNRSEEPIDLRGRYIWLSTSFFYGSGSCGRLNDETLRPGSILDTVVTVRFSQGCPDRKLGFELTPRHEVP